MYIFQTSPTDSTLLGIWFVLGIGVAFSMYDSACNQALSPESRWAVDRPVVLFLWIWLYCAVLFVAVLFLFVLLVFLPIIGAPIALGVIVNGLVKSIAKLWRLSAERRQREIVLHDNPIPPFQIGTPDLATAALVTGAVLLTLWIKFAHFGSAWSNIAWTMVTVVTEICAFLIAMDVCRRSRALAQPWPRIGFTAAVMIVSSVLPLFVTMLIAWRAWNYAMWKARV